MRKIALLTMAVMLTLSVEAAIDSKIDFEGGVPSTFSVEGGEIQTSALRYKDGGNSLRWSWNGPSRLIVTDYSSLMSSFQAKKSGLLLWIYNPTPIEDALRVDFHSATGQIPYTFSFNLNFKGWRACWIKYGDMEGDHSSKSITRMTISSPAKLESGELYLDRMSFTVSPVHDQVTPDSQIPNNNNHLKRSLWHWARLWEWEQYEWAIEPQTPSADDLKALKDAEQVVSSIVEVSMSSPQYIKGTIIPRALELFKKSALRRLDDGTVVGAPLLSPDECNTKRGELNIANLERMLYAFALSHAVVGDSSHNDDFFLIFDHAIEQGFAYGSGMGTNHHYGYNVRKIYDAVWLMREEITKRGKMEEYLKVLSYWSGIAECRQPYVYGRDELLDTWHTLLMPKVICAMLEKDDALRLRAMRSLSVWLSGSLNYTPGTIGGIKVDGTTFHHGGLYPAYSTGAFAAVGYFCRLSANSSFALSEDARRCLKHALMTMDFYTNNRSWGLGIAGRHPLNKNGNIPDADVNAFGYLALQGDLTGGGKRYDPDLAGAFLRMKGSDRSLYGLFKSEGISASANPEGFLVMNYGAVGIHRKGNWMVTLKAYNSDVWGSEIYTKDNRFGRYQSYGTVQVIGSGNPVSSFASGYIQEGWDWNRPPAATTIHLPFDKLNSPRKGTLMERNPERFSGVSSLQGEWGVLAAQYEERELQNFTKGARAVKSAFCFGNSIVFIGSGISNNNSDYPTETTLYQLYLDDAMEEVEFADERYTDFPLFKSRENVERIMLSDTKGNYYIVKGAKQLTLTKQEQSSPDDKSLKMESGKFATAYISHGVAPKEAGYEYAMYIQPSGKEISKFYKKDTYEVLQRDNTAHIVRDLQSGVVGYVFWEEYSSTEGILRASAESIVMERTDPTSQLRTMSICTPDLGITEKAYTTRQESQPIEKSITLKGEWQLTREVEGIGLKVQDGNTTITATCRHGKPVEFELRQNQ